MWLYKNEPFEEIPEDAYGYVYLITNNVTGKKYIGKKLFWFIMIFAFFYFFASPNMVA